MSALGRNHRLLALGTAAAIAAAAAAGIASIGSSSTQPGPAAMSRASLAGMLTHRYGSLEALTSASGVIVVGEIVDTVPRQYGRLPFSEATVRVTDVVAGQHQVGELLRVVETGGVFWGRAKDGTPASAGAQEVDFEGVPVMRPGERYLLFLLSYDGPVAAHSYVVTGEYQGKFRIGTHGAIEFSGDLGHLAESRFALTRTLVGREATRVVASLRQGRP